MLEQPNRMICFVFDLKSKMILIHIFNALLEVSLAVNLDSGKYEWEILIFFYICINFWIDQKSSSIIASIIYELIFGNMMKIPFISRIDFALQCKLHCTKFCNLIHPTEMQSKHQHHIGLVKTM